jgi:hypothetical protein
MAEVLMIKVKSIYGQIKGYYDNLPKILKGQDLYMVDVNVCKRYNDLLDELTALTETDYSSGKTDLERTSYGLLDAQTVKIEMGSIVSRLETEYDLNKPQNTTQPAIAIFNKNENNISIDINFSIEDLILAAKNQEEKENLEIISQEIKHSKGNWDKIRNSLGWILGYSKDLSLKLLPIVLDYYLKHPS